jgi:UDP-galactopyranose mutase
LASSPVVIIGAGLAGLSAAYHLEADYEIHEMASRPGGLCRSLTFDGFTFDSAVHVLYSKDPYASLLIRRLLGDELLTLDRSSWVFFRGVHTRYPFQANTYGLPGQIRADCILGLVEAQRRELGRTDPPTSFGDWIMRTFGSGIAEHFMLPLNRKLWGVDPSEMGWEWVIERIPQPRLEEVVLGALEGRSTQHGPNAVFWYPARGGMESLARAFLPFVQGLYLNSRVVKIRPIERTIVLADGAERSYRRLISTLPLPELVEIIDGAPEQVRRIASELRCNRVLAVHLGIDRPAVSDKHWVYYPELQFVFHRTSFPANFSPDLVPRDASSITAEVTLPIGLPSDGILDRVVADLRKAGVLMVSDRILVSHVQELHPAYVVYRPDHKEQVRALRGFFEPRGIFSCGRFGEWEYLNMDHAILSGKRAAEMAVGRPLAGCLARGEGW